MLFHKLLHGIVGFTSIIGTLALILVIGQQPAIAEQASDDPHAHHHHMVPEGVERTLVTYTIPEVNMINQDGQQVSLSKLLDSEQPVMMNFIFTSCTAICPAMSATFASVQKQLGSDSGKLLMVSISIDPEYDTPDALNTYAKRFKAGSQWKFLTGSLEDSISVQKAFDADRGDKMNHTPMTLMRATRNSQWVRYEGFATASELATEARNML